MRGWGQWLSRVTGKFSPTPKNFWQKIAVFLNTNVMINFFQNIALFLVKNAIFCQKLGKIAENCDHNIELWPP
jgi:hypothetical protein